MIVIMGRTLRLYELESRKEGEKEMVRAYMDSVSAHGVINQEPYYKILWTQAVIL